MKKIFLLLSLIVLMTQLIWATKYYSNGNNAPNLVNSWWTNTNGTGSNPLNFTTASDTLIIQAGHTMTTTATWTVSGTGSSVQINGTLVASNTVTLPTASAVNSGGTYQHNINGGTIPTATWDANSTCSVTGVTTSICTTATSTYGNFIWNCPGQNFTTAQAMSTLKVNNLTIMNTGTSGTYNQFRVQAQADSLINVNNNLNISGGIMWVAALGWPKKLNVGGNVTLTGGELDVVGTGGTFSGTLNITGNLSLSTAAILDLSSGAGTTSTGTVNLKGNYTQSGTSIVRVSTTSTGDGAFNFSGTSAQTFSKSGGSISCSSGNTLTFTINNNAIVDFGTSVLDNGTSAGNVNFALALGGSIITAHSQGLSTTVGTGSIQVGGTKTFNAGANYIYNGTGAQATGTGLPTTAITGGVTILSGASVTTTNAIVENGTLTVNGTLIPGAATQVMSGSGTLAGSGTVQVNRTAATADFSSQYTITNKALTNLTVEYTVLTGAQIVSALTYGNLNLDNISGINTTGGAVTVNGTLNTTAGGTLNMGTNALTIAIVNHAGILRTQNTSGIPITSGKTWGGTVTFDASNVQTIPASTFSNLILNNASGASLGGSATINGTLTFSAGNITLGANTLTLGGTVSGAGDGKCIVTSGAGVVSRAISAAGSFTFPVGTAARCNPVTLSNVAGGTYTAAVVAGESPATTNDAAAVGRTWNLAGTGPVDLTFIWNEGDKGSSCNPIQCTVWNYNGSWVDMGGGTSTVTSPVDTTAMAGMSLTHSSWTVGNTGALPVQMTSFTAVLQGTSALLKWSTATETNNSGFQIERSIEGSSVWAEVAFVNGAGTNSSPKTYSYEDKNLAPGKYVYRIKQIDNDGKTTIYNPNALPKVDAGVSNTLQLCGNYPNPFNPTTNMQFSVPQDGYASLKVYNMLGQEVATLFAGMAKAGHYIPATFNASRLASGIYFARLQYSGKSLMQRMLLMK